ncbi:relaxase/mobilization nuclease domain-containing protein [Dactylosporangium sucinum]|uniref:MobA/VirD2-like nuclease domain-containing protein n=1 Tax=Dactylosporangium sucinum TaxID=1424081 RepID=A0A917UE00_9ACTN|nr:hypothetical protein [Dactylosporangium sucinum]GGM86402.1 hypothetical protein GCM10007977_105360 [Dactylosporangium sucinum]
MAAWSGPGQLTSLQPATTPSNRHDVRPLARLLEQPVRAGRNPPQHSVWHGSVRNHATDRTLSDAQWAHIAGEMVAAVGIAPHDDPDAVRWVAIRHADDHIHIVATLVRQDGRTVWAWNERLKAQAAARDLEQRYGLYAVGPADRTSHRRPSPPEQNKSARQGLTAIPRDRLRRDVRACAAAAINEADFFAALRAAGLLVRLRRSTASPGEVTGYAVGLAAHRTARGDTVWYGGGRLAPDLTLPQLRRRWHSGTGPNDARTHPSTDGRTDAFLRAAAATQRAAERLTRSRAAEDAPALFQPVADILTSAARAFEGRNRGPLSGAAEAFDRAAREPYRRVVRQSRSASDLRALARIVATTGRLTGDRDTAAALQLLAQLAKFADNLADLREAQQRLHQARAARHAAGRLHSIVARGTSPGLTGGPVLGRAGASTTKPQRRAT